LNATKQKSATLTDLTVVSFNDTIAPVSKHEHTLAAVFATPVRANVKWADVEALFISQGAVISEGAGSRVRVLLNGIRAVFHRPHPKPEIDKAALKSVRRFLIEAGVTP
jgi:hypothetical protein